MKKKLALLQMLGILLTANYLSVFGQVDSTDRFQMFQTSVDEMLDLDVTPEEETVTTASQKVENLSDVPASMIVITQKQIIERGYQDLSDVLKDLAGVDYVENAGRFGEFYSIRGVDGSDRFLVLVNGRKINPPAGTFLSVGNSMSIGFASRIEIVYGACSIMYGADAFSCVINIISKNDINQYTTQLQSNYASFKTIDASFEALLPFKKDLSLVAFARNYSSDGFKNKNWKEYDLIKSYPPPLNNSFDQPIKDHTIFTEIKYKDFSLGYFRQYFNEGNARGLKPNFYIYNQESQWVTHQNVAWLNYRNTFKNSSVLTLDLSYTHYTQGNESRFFRLINNSPFNQFVTGIDRNIKFFGNYSQPFNRKTDYIVGLQFDYINSIPPYANDAIFGEPLRYEGSVAEIIKKELVITEKRMAIFGQLSYLLLPSLKFTAGMRFGYSTTNSENVNPRLALIYHPNNNHHIKLIYGTAFQAPSLFYQYEQFKTQTFVMVPNYLQEFGLKNQKINTFEIAHLFKLNHKTDINLSLYYSKAANLIARRIYTDSIYNDLTGGYTPAARNENLGKQYSIGGTLLINMQFSQHFASSFQYAYTDARVRIEKTWTDLPRIALHKAQFGITLRNLFKYVQITSSLRWTGPVSTPVENMPYHGTRAPGYFMGNMAISINNLVPDFRFFGKIENMIGPHRHVGILASGVYSDFIPQPVLNCKIGVEATF